MTWRLLAPVALMLSAGVFGCGADIAAIQATARRDPAKRVLIDASRDGNAWWGGYPSYQGKRLVDRLREMGFEVDELQQGARITDALLSQYNRVFVANGRQYEPDEFAAYDGFLAKPGVRLIIASEYLRPGQHDYFAERLGIPLTGITKPVQTYPTVARFASHGITAGAVPFLYLAGSAVLEPITNPDLWIIGWLSNDGFVDLNDDDLQEAGEPSGPAVMGVLAHPTARVFFTGDLNSLEMMPQPFVDNLIHWVFDDAPVGTTDPKPPIISRFSPGSGFPGTVVTIEGSNLSGGTAVAFNGTTASVIADVTATGLKATLPVDATTGRISVTTADGTATSATDFTVTASPGGANVAPLASSVDVSAEGPSYNGYTPTRGHLVDGTVLYWSGAAFASQAWATLTLDKLYSLTRIRVYTLHAMWNGVYGALRFTVEVSSDATQWQTVRADGGWETAPVAQTNAGGDNQYVVVTEAPFASTPVRYIRVTVNDSNYPGSFLWRTDLCEIEAGDGDLPYAAFLTTTPISP